jgi:hypothetical protein
LPGQKVGQLARYKKALGVRSTLLTGL